MKYKTYYIVTTSVEGQEDQNWIVSASLRELYKDSRSFDKMILDASHKALDITYCGEHYGYSHAFRDEVLYTLKKKIVESDITVSGIKIAIRARIVKTL